MPDTIDDARQMIESRLAEIEAETKQLQDALPHLRDDDGRHPHRGRANRKAAAGTGSSSRNGPRRPTRAKASKRAHRGQRREELLAAIESSPGARPSELAATIGIRPTQVSVLIAKARAEGLIVKSGDGYALRS